MPRSLLPAALLAAFLMATGPAPTAMASGAECSDEVDNDGDEHVDYPNDPDCTSPTDPSEWGQALPQCSDGIDNDGDGSTDYAEDLECLSPDHWSEEWPPACSDGQDNDHDGPVDWPADPDCSGHDDAREAGPDTPACTDGLDNDGDGPPDYPRDPDCDSPFDLSEATCEPSPVGCIGVPAPPCAGPPLPPLLVQTSSDDQGVHVTWDHPPLGIPATYLVYRVSVPDPTAVDIASIVMDLTAPHDSVDGSQTSYLDALASVAGTYVYWVVSADPDCRSMPSNAAPYVGLFPDLSECATLDKDETPPFSQGPSTACLNGWP